MGLDGAGRRRVESLLGRMSLDRKIGQMTQAERLSVTPAEVRDHHLGAVLSGGGSTPGANRPADWVAMADGFWEASAAGGPERGAVPVLYGVDAVHGNSNVLGATVFPHNIGLGAAGDPELMERIARVTARETLACGVDWAFAPTLAVARDDRWGRTYESYCEDPGIVASYAGRFVRALQADLGPDGVVACAKHWVGDGATTHGIDQGDAAIDRAELESLHVAPYRPAIEAGGAHGDGLVQQLERSQVPRPPLPADRPAEGRDGLRGVRGLGLERARPAGRRLRGGRRPGRQRRHRHGHGARELAGVHRPPEGARAAGNGSLGPHRRRRAPHPHG